MRNHLFNVEKQSCAEKVIHPFNGSLLDAYLLHMIDFRIGNCIGKGASGQVFCALDKNSGQTMAVKVINTSGGELRTIAEEVDLLKSLRHENIVHLYGYNYSNSKLEIIMEYCEGGSLKETITKYGKLTENLAAKYIQQVLCGLSYLHEQGVIHRDIKAAVTEFEAEYINHQKRCCEACRFWDCYSH